MRVCCRRKAPALLVGGWIVIFARVVCRMHVWCSLADHTEGDLARFRVSQHGERVLISALVEIVRGVFPALPPFLFLVS